MLNEKFVTGRDKESIVAYKDCDMDPTFNCDKLLFGIKTERPFEIERNHTYGSCGQVSDYEKLERIGQGTYGVVYKAKKLTVKNKRDVLCEGYIRSNGDEENIVALKKVKINVQENDEGLSVASIREIDILMKVEHKNIVKLREIVVGRMLTSIFMVLEYCDYDLATLVQSEIYKKRGRFTEIQVKCLLKQLLLGLEYLHNFNIIHRDIKPSNLLVKNEVVGGSNDNNVIHHSAHKSHRVTLKIADFGLSRFYNDCQEIKEECKNVMTPNIVTLWYRPPEILLSSPVNDLSNSIDMWSVGVVWAQLLIHRPMFDAHSQLAQINQIINVLGTPNEQIWPGFKSLPFLENVELPKQPYNNLRSTMPANFCQKGLNLMNYMLTYNPSKRVSASKALNSPYFMSFDDMFKIPNTTCSSLDQVTFSTDSNSSDPVLMPLFYNHEL